MTGVEPALALANYPLKVACLPISPHRLYNFFNFHGRSSFPLSLNITHAQPNIPVGRSLCCDCTLSAIGHNSPNHTTSALFA